MTYKTTNVILLSLIAVAVVISIIAYPELPEKIASHWNAAGTADGYMQKAGIFLLPFIMAVLFLAYWLIPKIDPLKANIESFRLYYGGFWIFLSLFILYIFSLQIAWNIGWRFNFSNALIPAFAVLWYVIGMVIEKSKRNWFVGIRTPWTLSSDVVWEETHRLGGKLFKIVGVISLLGLFFEGSVAITSAAILVVTISLITVIYSYIAFRKINRGPGN